MKLIDFPAVLTGLTKTYQRDITEIEKVHKRATKLTINLKNMSYTDRLLHLKLPTLKYRKLRGDMIDVFARPFVKRFALCYRTIVCLFFPVCNVGVLWPNGWTDRDETWRACRPRPWPYCVR